MKIRGYLYIFILICISAGASSQVNVNFNAAIYGQSLEGLSFAQLINSSSETFRAVITIKVRESSSKNVVTAAVSNVIIRPGLSSIDRIAFANGRFVFGNNDLGWALKQSGKFPEGEYEYCFEIETEPKPGGAGNYFENCFTEVLQPMTPLLLINPPDNEKDCNTRPTFTWQPPLPLPVNARFRFLLTELKDRQDVIEAINFNQPLINQGNIPGNQLQYPFNAPALKEGKSYAWQVIVYTEKTILKKSEIWTYSVKCEEVVKTLVADSYRELREIEDGNFYIADKVLRFSFNNPYRSGPLSYTIISLSNPDQAIKKLPELIMQSGLNKYDVDLSENKGFKDGKEYLLKIKLLNNRTMSLRFIYKEEDID